MYPFRSAYPLRFAPIFRRYLWGGHRLARVMGKQVGHESCAESWELVDHGDDQSVVLAGELAGRTLGELVQGDPVGLLGERLANVVFSKDCPENLRGRFPLLFKFLDAAKDLSVQVHPDDQMGAALSPPDLGKTEAWYVLDAEEDSRIYAGLRPGVTDAEFRQAVLAGTVEDMLHSFRPEPGDCVFIRAGTVHAIGAGLLVAEIQQASDTTFRLFDWNRVDADGKPRDLHIEQGLQAIDFSLGPIHPTSIEKSESGSRLCSCDKFELRRHDLSVGQVWEPEAGHMRIVAVIAGSLQSESDPVGEPLAAGQTALIPAACGKTEWAASEGTQFLEVLAGARE